MRRHLPFLILAALSSGALAADLGDSRAAELAGLRREVETLSSDLGLRKEDLRSRLKAVEAQKVEIEVQIRREELRLAQIEGEAAARREELARDATRGDALGPAVVDSMAKVRTTVEHGLPFHVPERLAELDKLASQLGSGLITSEAASARLWAFTEDELRLCRENGLDRQVIQLDGADVLADVARLGMVALYFKTDGGVVGVAVPSGGGWSWRAVTSRDDQKAVLTLFEKLQHGVRSGAFPLPNPSAGAPS